MATIQRAGLQRGDLALWDGLTKTTSRPDATGATVTGLTAFDFVDVLQVYGSGIDRTAATISRALSTIGTSPKVKLVFATGTWSIASNITVPSNIVCEFPAGAVVSVDSGITLTFSGETIVEDSANWKTGSGTVVVSRGGVHGAIYHQTAAERTALVTPTYLQYEPGNVLRYGMNTTPGTTDMAAAIQAAIDVAEAGGRAYVPAGTYLITSQLSIADGTPITLYGDGNRTIIKKGFNGDMLSLGLKSELTQIYLDGNGANFTGRGVIIQTGSGGDGYQNIHDCTILDTTSHNIEYTAVGAGFGSRIVNNRLGVYNRPAVYAVKYPDDPGSALDNGPRLLAFNVTLGPLADIAGASETSIIGNIAGEDVAMTVPTLRMDVDAFATIVVGNQLVSNTPLEFLGDECLFVGNICRAGFSFESGATNSIASANHGSGDATLDIDNSGTTSNQVWGVQHSYTPTWNAGVTPPTLGDGTLTGKWQRLGRQVHLQIELTIGSTTNVGSGFYTFSLPTGVPTPGTGASYGICRAYDSSAPLTRVGVVICNGGPVFCEIDSAAGSVTQASPWAWAVSDKLSINITYNI